MSTKIIIGCTNGNSVEHLHGRVRVQVCTLEQHTSCSDDEQRCQRMRPTCLAEECVMLSKKLIDTKRRDIYAKITEADQRTINRKLHRAWQQCHRVEITIEED